MERIPTGQCHVTDNVPLLMEPYAGIYPLSWHQVSGGNALPFWSAFWQKRTVRTSLKSAPWSPVQMIIVIVLVPGVRSRVFWEESNMPEVVQRPSVRARNAFAVSWSCDLRVWSYYNKTCPLPFAVEEVTANIESSSMRICQRIGSSFNYLAGQCLIQDSSDF